MNTALTINEGAELTATAVGGNVKALLHNAGATLTNSIPGTGWTDAEGADGKTGIEVSATERDLSLLDSFKRV